MATTTKSSFLKGFLSKVQTDAETIGTDIKQDFVYSADVALANIKTEGERLDSLISTKVNSIIEHNKNILSIQGAIKVLEDEVSKAQTLKDKIVTALS